MKMTLPLRLYIGCAVSVLLVILIGSLSLYTSHKQEEEELLVNHTYQVLGEVEDIRNMVFLIETSRRGFRSTNEKTFLEPYFEVAPQILTKVQGLKKLMGDNPEQVNRIEVLGKKIEGMLVFYKNIGEDPKVFSRELRISITGKEKIIVSAILGDIEKIEQEERKLLRYREIKNKTLRKNTEIVIQIGTFLILIIVCVLVFLVINEFKNKIKAYQKEHAESQLKSRFVSMASHEFRTPLSSIQLSASLIEKYLNGTENQKILKHTAKIKGSVENLTTILNDFLSLERLEGGKIEAVFEDFNLVELCEGIKEDLGFMAKPGQTLAYHHRGAETRVELDKNLLRNCLINLVSNAIKYSGEDTTIQINTEINDKGCTISVTDNGIGIPETDQEKLFEPFFRAGNTSNISGTGLGLNIVSRYVKLMNGTLSFASKLNKGSTFILTFTREN